MEENKAGKLERKGRLGVLQVTGLLLSLEILLTPRLL